MALFKAILGELSGSIGDNVFSHNRGGRYARQRSVPTNPNSSRQQDVRTALQLASSAWSTLTEAQATAWNAWATANPVLNRLGDPINLTGQQAYVQLNSRILGTGISPTPAEDPPTGTNPTPLLTLAGTNETPTADLDVSFTATPLGTGMYLYAWWSGWVRPNSDPNIRQARFLGVSGAADASPTTFTLPVASTTGTDQQGNLWVAVLSIDGRISAYLKARVIPAAP